MVEQDTSNIWVQVQVLDKNICMLIKCTNKNYQRIFTKSFSTKYCAHKAMNINYNMFNSND